MDCMALSKWIGWLRHHGILKTMKFEIEELYDKLTEYIDSNHSDSNRPL